MKPMERMSTPCVNFCWIDPGHGLCEGCGRTRDEVARWYLLGEPERLAVMARLKERLARALDKPTPATGAAR